MSLFTFIFGLFLFSIGIAQANPACAVCTVAVGASLEVARRLGVDDSVVGVWSGAFLLMLGYWTLKWMDKRGWHFLGRDPIILSSSVLMILFIYISYLPYQPRAILVFWLDPFLFSALCGALVLHYSAAFYQWMKRKNGGHAHFPFEKVVVPVVALGITSFIFSELGLCQVADLSNI